MEITPEVISDEGPSDVAAPRHHHSPSQAISPSHIRRNPPPFATSAGSSMEITQAIKSADEGPFPRASSERGGQELLPSPPLEQFMKYMVPSELIFVTLKYQGTPQSLFLENPAFWCFLASFLYWLIEEAMKQTTDVQGNCFRRLSCAAIASAILSVIFPVSILFPYPVSLLPLTTLISFPVILALPYASRMFRRGIEYVINKIHSVFVWARGCNSTEEALPPV